MDTWFDRAERAQHDAREDILVGFAATDSIDFAYPTRRFFDKVTEGKTGALATPPAGKLPVD